MWFSHHSLLFAFWNGFGRKKGSGIRTDWKRKQSKTEQSLSSSSRKVFQEREHLMCITLCNKSCECFLNGIYSQGEERRWRKHSANRHTLNSSVQGLQTFSSGWTGGQTLRTLGMKVLIRTIWSPCLVRGWSLFQVCSENQAWCRTQEWWVQRTAALTEKWSCPILVNGPYQL